MKLTKWISVDTPPTIPGGYEVKYGTKKADDCHRMMWSGSFWWKWDSMGCADYGFLTGRNGMFRSPKFWRGLAEDPSKKDKQ
jgi:hypothetical protein